jgi:putative transposase
VSDLIDEANVESVCGEGAAARPYFEKSTEQNGKPETVTIDKSSSNLAALQAPNARRETPIRIRQRKYLNNIVEQEHVAIKRRTRPMPGFKDLRCACILFGDIEIMHMIRKGLGRPAVLSRGGA